MNDDTPTATATTMDVDHTAHNLKTYWRIWGMLLALTMVMLFLDQVSMPRALFVTVMVAAMLTKASLIAAFFMHLRYEHPFLRASFVVGLMINGAFLFALMIPDALRIYRMVNG